MKLTQAVAPTTTSGGKTENFSIALNAKMFSILTDKLYSNKEGAIIQELSANARDAHLKAGKMNTPFELQLPTWLDAKFRIRDYGTGINPDEFHSIYNSLGTSTKDEENLSIGAFGLGSKTPFACTDIYTIENYYNGTKYVYSCFKDQGFPKSLTVGEEPTDEENGLAVSFVLDPDKKTTGGISHRLTEECKRKLKYFDLVPHITGGTSKIEIEKYPDLEKYGWFMAKGDMADSLVVVMGGISYSSGPYSLPDVVRKKLSDITNQSMVLKVELGDVDIPPSREGLEFTQRTIDYLLGRLVIVSASYIERVKEEMLKAESPVQAMQTYNIYSTRALSATGIKEFNTKYGCFNNNDTLEDMLLSVCPMTPTNQLSIRHKKYRSDIKSKLSKGDAAYRDSFFYRRNLNEPMTVYINDIGSTAWKYISEAELDHHCIFIIAPNKAVERAEYAQNIKKVLDKFGMPKVHMLSSVLTIPEATKAEKYKRKVPDQVFKVLKEGLLSKDCATELPSGGYYIPVKVREMAAKDVAVYSAHIAARTDKELFGVRSKILPDIMADPEFMHVTELDKEITALCIKERNRYIRVRNLFEDLDQIRINIGSVYYVFDREEDTGMLPKFMYHLYRAQKYLRKHDGKYRLACSFLKNRDIPEATEEDTKLYSKFIKAKEEVLKVKAIVGLMLYQPHSARVVFAKEELASLLPDELFKITPKEEPTN